MKNKVVNNGDLVTRGVLQEELKKYPTRSEMFDRFDQMMRVLEQIREDILFHTHDIHCLKEADADHEKRLKKLETRSKN